ncbi:MAG: hypothetical protein WCL37_03785 [Chrysiogenales bacterium]
MIKKQQKWIALLVILAFVWLLQVSTMPLAANETPEQIGAASAEQGPDFVEAVKHKAAPPPKKSILPYVLIGVGVVAVAAVLFLVVLKTKYDITGEWRYSWKYEGATDWAESNQELVFSGDKKSGTLILWDYPGTYTVEGKDVSFTLNYLDYGPLDYVTHTGAFVSKDKISGTWKYEENGNTGAFEAVRAGATAKTGSPQVHRDAPGRIGKK